jgi:hypothetical protein
MGRLIRPSGDEICSNGLFCSHHLAMIQRLMPEWTLRTSSFRFLSKEIECRTKSVSSMSRCPNAPRFRLCLLEIHSDIAPSRKQPSTPTVITKEINT